MSSEVIDMFEGSGGLKDGQLFGDFVPVVSYCLLEGVLVVQGPHMDEIVPKELLYEVHLHGAHEKKTIKVPGQLLVSSPALHWSADFSSVES